MVAAGLLPAGYDPLYFASAVLPDGRVLVEGGEYVGGGQAESLLGAIYDPVTNAWTSVSPPAGWPAIGDGESIILANGTFMLGNSESSVQALFNPTTLTWTATGTGKADGNSEEGWALLPNGKVLTVDTTNGTASELYDPSTGAWTLAGNTPAALTDASSQEIGPMLLMPDGRVFAMGGTANTAIYGTDGTWTAGPMFPMTSDGQVDMADAPAAVLPNGHILAATSPGVYQTSVHYLDFDGTKFTEVARTPNSPNVSSYNERFVVLPTGEVMNTDNSGDIEIYTATGKPNAAWAPAITSVPSSLTRGTTYVVTGTQFNGLTLGATYGDDAQMSTNYPLVRITNNATGHVFYAKTHGHSSMGVATGKLSVSTSFDVPAGAEAGASKIVVVANGIPSAPFAVTLK